MNVLMFYADRMENFTYGNGKVERGLVLRRGKSNSAKTISDGKFLFTELGTGIMNGTIVHRDNGDRFIIISKQSSADCVQMQGRRINGDVEVIEIKDKYENHKKVGKEESVVADDVPVYFTDINASMRQYDAGLLPKTIKKIIMRTDVPIDLLYRIKLNGRNYQVDNIDTAKYVDLYEVQVSEDTRK